MNTARHIIKYVMIFLLVLCMLFALSGLILSLFSGKDQDKLQLFSRIGLVLNAAVLCLCGVILYYGVI